MSAQNLIWTPAPRFDTDPDRGERALQRDRLRDLIRRQSDIPTFLPRQAGPDSSSLWGRSAGDSHSTPRTWCCVPGSRGISVLILGCMSVLLAFMLCLARRRCKPLERYKGCIAAPRLFQATKWRPLKVYSKALPSWQSWGLVCLCPFRHQSFVTCCPGTVGDSTLFCLTEFGVAFACFTASGRDVSLATMMLEKGVATR